MSESTIHEVRGLVIDVFPSVESWVRLEACYLMEYSKDWRSDRSYIKREEAQEVIVRNRTFLTAQAAS